MAADAQVRVLILVQVPQMLYIIAKSAIAYVLIPAKLNVKNHARVVVKQVVIPHVREHVTQFVKTPAIVTAKILVIQLVRMVVTADVKEPVLVVAQAVRGPVKVLVGLTASHAQEIVWEPVE